MAFIDVIHIDPKMLVFGSGFGRIDPGCDPNPGSSKIWVDPTQNPKILGRLNFNFLFKKIEKYRITTTLFITLFIMLIALNRF